MPRRQRKRSATQRKPSLIFTESPTNCSYSNLPSPVRCASHPATAEAVPVEELGDVTWVSPQFRGQPVSCRARGRTRRVTRSRTQLGKENLHSTIGPRSTLPKGFVPLRLQGEENTEISDIQDVSEEVDIDLLDSPQYCRTDFDEHGLNASSTLTPPTVQCTNVLHRPNGEKCTGHNTDSPDHPTNCRQNLNWSVLSSTQTRQHVDMFPKVLFPESSTQNMDNPAHQNQSNFQPTLGHVGQANARMSIRLREKYQQALGLFRTPVKTSECGKDYKVLVVDTPECEYGLTLRERRFKSLRLRMK